MKDPQVLFAGYKVPHPLEHLFVVRIQTAPDYSPAEAMTNAITDLLSEISLLEERFKVSMSTASELFVHLSISDSLFMHLVIDYIPNLLTYSSIERPIL